MYTKSVYQNLFVQTRGRLLAADILTCYTETMKNMLISAVLRPILMMISGLLMALGLFGMPEHVQRDQKADAQNAGKMSVYFFDVGQADAALIVADGEAMLIDGGNTADSSQIVSSLRRIGISHLSVIVCSHAHEDHVGGLAGALNICSVDKVYAPVTEYDSYAFSDFVTYAQKRGCTLTVPIQGDTFTLGGATVQFLSPVRIAETVNDTSLVVRVVYGEHSFLFTGDTERSAELQMLDDGVVMQSTVLKVGHHGSDSSTSYVFLREVMPQYAVISVEKENSYGFPDEVVLSRLADMQSVIYRTDLCGEIVFETDGSTLTVSTEKAYSAADSVSQQEKADPIPTDARYVGNEASLKFHKTSCQFLPAEKNRCYFSLRASAVEAGYTPCGQCKP